MRILCPWNSPGKNNWEGAMPSSRGIFSTQWLNPGLPHCRWILYHLSHRELKTSLVTQMVKHLPTMRETRVHSLGWEDLLEQEMVIYSSILVWKIPWLDEPGKLQSMGLQRVGHNWETSHSFSLCYTIGPCWLSILYIVLYVCTPSISITSDMHMTPHLWYKAKKNCDESERGLWKSWLKT